MKLGMRLSVLCVGLLVLAGCDEGEFNVLGEQAALQAQKQVDAENENLLKRAAEMEADLASRQRFYEGVRGTYEGVFQTDAGEFNMRVTLVPSVPPYRSSRIRSLEEIASDLSNLHFNIQIVQWSPSSPMSAVGCRIEEVRPDLVRGRIDIASENCANAYVMTLSEGALREAVSREAESIAEALIGGSQNTVSRIVGQVLPSTTASIYEFSVVRMEQ